MLFSIGNHDNFEKHAQFPDEPTGGYHTIFQPINHPKLLSVGDGDIGLYVGQGFSLATV